MLKFFHGKIPKQSPLGYLTVTENGNVEVDPQTHVVLEDADYTVKDGDKVIVLSAYPDTGGDPANPIQRTITLPDPALWKGRVLTFHALAWEFDGTEAIVWLATGLFSNYASIVVSVTGPTVPGTVGTNVPPFNTTSLTLILQPQNDTTVYHFYSDGVGWVNGLDALPNVWNP